MVVFNGYLELNQTVDKIFNHWVFIKHSHLSFELLYKDK